MIELGNFKQKKFYTSKFQNVKFEMSGYNNTTYIGNKSFQIQKFHELLCDFNINIGSPFAINIVFQTAF